MDGTVCPPIWSHGSDSILGMTRTATHACMLIYWALLVPNRLHTGKKAEIRQWICLANGIQYVGIRKVKLERAVETSAVDSSDFVCLFHHILGPRFLPACSSRHT